MKKITTLVAGMLLVPVAALALTEQDQREPADGSAAPQAEERDARLDAEAGAPVTPAGCCWVIINGRPVCIPGC